MMKHKQKTALTLRFMVKHKITVAFHRETQKGVLRFMMKPLLNIRLLLKTACMLV